MAITLKASALQNIVTMTNARQPALSLFAAEALRQGIGIELTANNDPNAIGEILRDAAFGKPHYCGQEEIPYFERIAEIPARVAAAILGDLDEETGEIDDIRGYKSDTLGFSVFWFSDGDLTLLFSCDDFAVINEDEKKRDNWKLIRWG